jgi:hypothetical protein
VNRAAVIGDQEVKDQARATMRMIYAHDSCASFPGVVAGPALSSAARTASARSCRGQMCLDGDRFGTGDLGHLIQSGKKQRRARGAFRGGADRV